MGAAEPIHMADEEQDDLYTGWWKTLPNLGMPFNFNLPLQAWLQFPKDGTG